MGELSHNNCLVYPTPCYKLAPHVDPDFDERPPKLMMALALAYSKWTLQFSLLLLHATRRVPQSMDLCTSSILLLVFWGKIHQ